MKIALAGNVGSGKSTIAEELSNRGFYLLNYTELIKEEVAHAMAAVGVTGDEKEALDKIHKDKEFYRPLLIAWADATGWSTGERMLKILPNLQQENIVLDNIRYPSQADILKNEGFYLLHLDGGTFLQIPSERGLDTYSFDMHIPWMGDVQIRVDYILSKLTSLQK